MKFIEFVQKLEELEQTSSRLSMTDILAGLLQNCSKKGDEIMQAVYLIQGRVAPQHEPIEFSFSEKLILRAIVQEVHISKEIVDKVFKKAGDIGSLIEELNLPERNSGLSISDVFEKLNLIAVTSGTNSQTFKEEIYRELFKKCSNLEVKYINRILTGNLRLGLSSKTVLDSLAQISGDKKNNRIIIENAYGVRTDLGLIATLVITKGIDSMKGINVEPGTPVAPKLVEREKNSTTIFERIPDSIVQPKLDGLRVHAHYKKSGFKKFVTKKEIGFFEDKLETVKLFSRNLESLTDMFPDIVDAVNKLAGVVNAESFIIDGEAIGIDLKTGAFLPFQETIKRRRKNDISAMSESHPVKLFTFDILELNGKDLLLKRTDERVEILRKMLEKGKSDKIIMTESTYVKSAKEIQSLFEKYVGEGYEGIIVKDVKSEYKPGTRNFDWIKLKAGSTEGLSDAIDGVVLGYYAGAGTRTKFGIGAILIGIYNKKDSKFYSLAKVGTGFKDADWAMIKPVLDKLKVDSIPDNVIISDSLRPDVIVVPQIVVEVEADMITKSKIHGGAEGYSLRFPRLKIFGRDKDAEGATTVEEVKRMFELQGK